MHSQEKKTGSRRQPGCVLHMQFIKRAIINIFKEFKGDTSKS